MSQTPSLKYLRKILTPEVSALLNSTSELTLFLPIDGAWDVLPEIERRYLESEFATDDTLRILNMHAVAAKGVYWSESFEPNLNRQSLT